VKRIQGVEVMKNFVAQAFAARSAIVPRARGGTSRAAVAIALLTAATIAACGGDPAGPSRPQVAGTYVLTELSFDPQGVLPEVELLSRLAAADVPRLILAPDGQAQLVFRDPATGLITTANGRFATPTGGIRVDFLTDTSHRTVLLSRRMTFDEEDGRISFDGTSPDGVSRARLLQLVPEWAQEQLLDPVPGRLTVAFTLEP
jgi:hypothetical protein